MDPTPHPAPPAHAANPFVDFVRGAGDVWRAMGLLIGHPSLWLWAMIPFALVCALFAGLCWGAWHWAAPWLHDRLLSGDGLPREMLGWLLGALFWIAFGLLVFFLFVPLASLVASPFNDLLSEKVERIYAGASAQGAFGLRVLVRSVRVGLGAGLRLMALTLGLLLVSLMLCFVPLVGPTLAVAAATAITIRFLALEFTSYSMDRRLYDWPRRRAFLRRNRARTIGLGAMAFVFMMVPVLNAVFIPVSAIAGTLLFCDVEIRPGVFSDCRNGAFGANWSRSRSMEE